MKLLGLTALLVLSVFISTAQSGYVGIGTSAPASRLDIISNGDGPGFADDISVHSYGASTGPALVLYNASGTPSSTSNLGNNRFMGALEWAGYVNGSFTGLSEISSTYQGNGTTGLSDLNFKTSGSTRAYINALGNFGVATLSPLSTLQINGSIAGGIRAIAASTSASMLTTDYLVKVNAGTSYTLDDAANAPGRIVYIINIGASAASVLSSASTSQVVDLGSGSGASSLGVPALTRMMFLSDGANWYRML